ncbi:MAG: phosphatidylserine decarboxylase family protein [Melioribacteraceae bacterium]|nr:phosphatidylserine decarboxylase family protein [Melioribacteraceae bacterium]
MITKYGLNTFLICSALSALAIIISLFINNPWVKYPLLIVGVIFFLFVLNFFRDPERISPKKDNVIVSPADGEIVIIKEKFEDRFLNEEATQVSVFMSPLNVHVNRIPIDGTVDYLKYINGEYIMAFYEKADERNERSEIGISSKFGKMLYTQVAGFIARRIVYDLSIGDTVNMGNRFGMIKFGSRCDVVVPKNWKLKVKIGDIVKAGETVLFEMEDK